LDASIDSGHFQREGWVRVPRAIPEDLCRRLVDVLEQELRVPVHDPVRWPEYGGPMRDLIPIWGHQTQWDIRQHPNLHRIWATLWGIDALRVSVDSCRFTPPWRPGYAASYGLHWDHAPKAPGVRFLQGVLAFAGSQRCRIRKLVRSPGYSAKVVPIEQAASTDTAVDQGGWRCVPTLYHAREEWPETPVIDADGDEAWPADASGREIVYVPAAAGDLIVWDWHLPYGNSKNLADRPRPGVLRQHVSRQRQQRARTTGVGGVLANGPLCPLVARPTRLRPRGALATGQTHTPWSPPAWHRSVAVTVGLRA
jgi:hypothetical protein